MEVKVDYKQIVGEVKERNKLYNAIIEIRELAEDSIQSITENDTSTQEKFCKIKTICDKATEGII